MLFSPLRTFCFATLVLAACGSVKAVSAAPPTVVLSAPIITRNGTYQQFVTETNPLTLAANPNLPAGKITLTQTPKTRLALLDMAVAGTGFTLDIPADIKANLAKEKNFSVFSGGKPVSAAAIINGVLRQRSALDPMDYSVNGTTITVFHAAKDAEGFPLHRVNVDATDAPLDTVLRDLLTSTGYGLFLPLRLSTRVSVHCENVTVSEALRQILSASPRPLKLDKMTGGDYGTLLIQEAKPSPSPV